jgi:Raf kinase inhibitor-like YbhB/YbcL family protein
MAGIELRSSSFSDHAFLPARHAHDRDNLSPALVWSGVPEQTSELVLLCEDLDAPRGPFVHWLVTGIDPQTSGVDEGQTPPGGHPARNGYGETGWGGPQPPAGDDPHRYAFRLYALRQHRDLPAEPKAQDVHGQVEKAALASGTLVGRYQR